MKPQISIIVPVFNGHEYLSRCLDSLAAQTYENIEIILIDDGSTDNSAEICRRYSERDGRFRYIYQENAGVSAARNTGLARANGTYIGFCDSDDWAEPDMYAFLYDLIRSAQAEAAVCGFYTDTDGLGVGMHTAALIDGKTAVYNMYTNDQCGGYLWNKLFRRDKIEQLRLSEHVHVYEDMLFFCEVCIQCDRIILSSEKKYHYCYNEDSALHGKFRERDWSAQAACHKLSDIIDSAYPELSMYPRKSLIGANLAIADKLAVANFLHKANYLRIKKEIDACQADRKTLALLGKRRKISYRIFRLGRRPYVIYRKLLGNRVLNAVGRGLIR